MFIFPADLSAVGALRNKPDLLADVRGEDLGPAMLLAAWQYLTRGDAKVSARSTRAWQHLRGAVPSGDTVLTESQLASKFRLPDNRTEPYSAGEVVEMADDFETVLRKLLAGLPRGWGGLPAELVAMLSEAEVPTPMALTPTKAKQLTAPGSGLIKSQQNDLDRWLLRYHLFTLGDTANLAAAFAERGWPC